MKLDMSDALQSVRAMGQGFVERLPYIVIALIVFALFSVVGRLVRSTMRHFAEKRRKHLSLGLVMGRLAHGLIVFIGLLIALVIALPGFQPAQLIQLLGISSVAIGFAFKDILQNFLAGILILLTEPFRIGDQIRVGEFEGTVEDIQTRATFIKTYDGRRIVIPNGNLFNQSVIVNTAYAERRFDYDVGVGYGDDVERARALILEAIKSVPDVLREPAPDVLVFELAGSTVNIRARWWVKPPRRADELQVRDAVLFAIKNTLTQNGIDLPFPTQQILFHDQTEASDGDRSRQREGWPAGQNEVPPPARLGLAVEQVARERESSQEFSNTSKDESRNHSSRDGSGA